MSFRITLPRTGRSCRGTCCGIGPKIRHCAERSDEASPRHSKARFRVPRGCRVTLPRFLAMTNERKQPMRIWHQSFTVLQDLPAYVQVLKERIATVVRPDTEVVLHGQIPGTYTSEYPGSDLAYGVLYWMHGLQWLAAAREAEKQGFDAMVLASIAGPMA